ncbi:MAG: tRNA (guanosine(46)-N7)-methyltransferase TrmB, partial [Helicobacter sp.]|nr:tRNA (guanosine(46)-N7)-methyltransferase TrmB [Helicobacter sp.]
MPHFKSTSLTIPALPFCSSHYEHEIHILAHFTSCAFKNSSLLHARYILQKFSPKDFFLTIKKDKSHQYLVKCDKYSKIAPIEIAKNTLLLLANKQQNLLSHNLNPKNISPRFKLPFIKNIQDFLDFSALLKNLPLKQPKIWLEIGFGSGRHLLHNAKTNPEILHIGLEIHHPSLEQVARQIGLCNLKNILILSYDARIFLELLPTNALDRIFVHFPVPWEKKPHRRIFTPSFLKHAHRVLKDNSTLELRTDSQEYFKDSVVLAEDSKLFTLQKFKNKPADIISKYEARWIREQKDIYDLNLTANAIPKKERIVYDFSFPKGDLLKHLPTVDLSN